LAVLDGHITPDGPGLGPGSAARPLPLPLPLPDAQRRALCEALMGDLHAAAAHPAGGADPAVVGGTLGLLKALLVPAAAPPPATDRLLSDAVGRGLLPFLLVRCLGLVPRDSLEAANDAPAAVALGQSPLCSDDGSRQAAYALLAAVCAWRPALVDAVYASLRPVVASLPPLVAWDYKPARETRSSTGFVGLRNKGSTCYMNSLLQVRAIPAPCPPLCRSPDP